MRQPSLFLAVALSALLCGAQSPAPNIAPNIAPGMVNYIDGQALAGGQVLEPGMLVKTGQSLTTSTAGKVELLLTPGAFLRVGDNSRVILNSASLAVTEVQVERGRAIVEVAQIAPQSKLRVNLNGAVVRIQAGGLYDFDAAQNQIRVFNGTADVSAYGMRITLTDGHWLDLNSQDLLVASRFDAIPDSQDDLYEWSSLRSAYLAEANISAAESATSVPDAPNGGGWSWNPSYDSYTFVPDNGICFSPFGWGFYSPILAYRAPITVAPGPIHRFHLDPGKWGPGHHYAVTQPQPLVPTPPPGYRHVEQPGPAVRFQSAPAEAVTAPDNTPGNNPASNNPASSSPAPRVSMPVNGFRETAPVPHFIAPSEPAASRPSPMPRMIQPVQSFHPVPPVVQIPAPVMHTAPHIEPQPAPAAPHVAPQPAPAAPHVAPQPAPAAPRSTNESKRN